MKWKKKKVHSWKSLFCVSKGFWTTSVWMNDGSMSILGQTIPLMSRLIIILVRTLEDLNFQEAMFAVASLPLLLCDKPISQITELRHKHLTELQTRHWSKDKCSLSKWHSSLSLHAVRHSLLSVSCLSVSVYFLSLFPRKNGTFFNLFWHLISSTCIFLTIHRHLVWACYASGAFNRNGSVYVIDGFCMLCSAPQRIWKQIG